MSKTCFIFKTKCQNKSRSVFIATRTMARQWIYLRVEWQGRCLLTVISTHIAELIVFAFSDNLSAENSKFSADSGIHGIHFLECMRWGSVNMAKKAQKCDFLARTPTKYFKFYIFRTGLSRQFRKGRTLVWTIFFVLGPLQAPCEYK